MVGIVFLKDFETCSYKNMKITFFDGDTYKDINSCEAFHSYVCNPDTSYAKHVFSTPKNNLNICLEDVLFVARMAREYFYENISATQLEFKLNGKDIHFKIRNRTCGVCAPANYRSLFLNDSLYMHISSEDCYTYTYLSAMCDALNFAVQKILLTSEEVYFHSCGGVYINIALFNPLRVKAAKSDVPSKIIRSVFGLNRRKTVRLKMDFTYNPPFPDKRPVAFHSEQIYLYKKLKYDMYKLVSDILSLANGKTDILRLLFSLPLQQEVRDIAHRFEKAIKTYSLKYFEYGYLDAKSYCEMMSAREILSYLLDVSDTKKFNKELSSRSSDKKFCSALPCPKYILSDATAIW